MLGLKIHNGPNLYHHNQDKAQRKKIEDYSYGLYDKIGKGYSSIVYKGRNDNTGEVVAIKVIDMKGVKDDVGRQMLDCEIQALKTLNHPNVLKCYDVFTTANNCYIITELCNQGDLSALITKKKRLSELDTIKFIKDICLGFFEIASNNFLHRDLKLANIFLKDGVAKIADFGFAKKNKNPGQKEKYNVGSPLYMPPQSLKNNIYSVKSDIWSVGIIIYQMLHGQTPWECKTQKELMDKMLRIPISFKIPLSEDLKDFIRKCLEIDDSRRFNLEQMKSHPLIQRMCGKENQIQIRPPALVTKPSETYKPLGKKDSNKENIESHSQSYSKNNDQVVEYINIFRLLYKISSKLRQSYPDQKSLIQSLCSSVLTRINNLKILSEKPNSIRLEVLDLSLKGVQSYFDSGSNPSIKKYVRVINDYHKKYSQDLRQYSFVCGVSAPNVSVVLRQFLLRNEIREESVTLFYWISEYLTLPKHIKKQALENIVQPKGELAYAAIWAKIKKILQ